MRGGCQSTIPLMLFYFLGSCAFSSLVGCVTLAHELGVILWLRGGSRLGCMEEEANWLLYGPLLVCFPCMGSKYIFLSVWLGLPCP
jgi:hypothetical protein